MKPQQWRPSARLRKRRIANFSIIDVSGLGVIALFLIVFFMIGRSSSQIQHDSGIVFVHGQQSTLQPGASKEDALILTVSRDDTIYFGNTKFDIGQGSELLQKAVRHGSETKVYLRVDARAQYRAVNILLDQIRAAKIEKVVLITD